MPSVFISYSHKDEVWKDRLQKHLGVLENQGLLDVWDDRRIGAGDDWLPEIESAIERVSVAVLLISADFLTSKFILGQEVPRLLERRATEGISVFPVIVRPCVWQEVKWLSPIQARPLDGRPLSEFKGRWEGEMVRIAQEILHTVRGEGPDNRMRGFRDPKDDFLARVEEVCRLRESGAEVERVQGSGAIGDYLRVWRTTGRIPDAYPVGAIEHGLSRDSLSAFLLEVDKTFRKEDSQLPFVLIYGGEAAPESLLQEAKEKRVDLVRFEDYQRLIDFQPYVLRQTEKLARDQRYPPQLYVEQRMRYQFGGDEEETSDALARMQEWLSSPQGRFLVILGDFGTGKTFLLRELARRLGEQEEGLVPILLQMNELEKRRDLNALVVQHFAQGEEWVADFSPGRFRYMLAQGQIALLFDGFDELALRVTYERATEHFDTLLQAAVGAAKVIVTSRRQHFLSEKQVRTALAERVQLMAGHRLAILQPFNRDQIQGFLLKLLKSQGAAERRLRLIDHVKDLLGLSHNPRLLGFIAELPEEQLVEAAEGKGEITAARLYELLFERWLVGEFERVHPKGAPPGLSVEDRWRGVTALALRLWQKTDSSAGLSELAEDAAHVIEALDPSVAAFQLGSGTLLVRDEDGNFSFLHQSVLEWLVARSATEELKSGKRPESLVAREMSPLMADFLGSLATRQVAAEWARWALSKASTEAAKKNALLVLERMGERVQEVARLAGQNLRGKDLSYQDLTAADFAGANLTGARLIETRLEGARLTEARLVDADLSGAVLSGADLSGANFTGARLFGSDLRGALLDDVVLRRAKLLGALPGSYVLQESDTFGAALDLPPSLEGLVAGWPESVQSVAWSPGGDLLATAQRTVIRIWDVASGQEIRRILAQDNTILSIAFSPDGKSLASGSEDNTIRLWQIDSGEEARRFLGHDDAILSVAFSPNGKILASGSSDRTARLWHLDSGQEIQRLQGYNYPIWSVAFSPDGKHLASGSSDNIIRLWQVDSGKEIQQFLGHSFWVRSVAFSPDGLYLGSGSSDNTVRLWHIASGKTVLQFQGHSNWVWSVAFSPDGLYLASGSSDNTIRLLQIAHEPTLSGHEIRKFEGHLDWILGVAFSPDGQHLASVSIDNTARIWQVASGQEIRRFQGHHLSVGSVTFSPDGKFLASSCEDGKIRLWLVASGQEVRQFQGHNKPVSSVAFSPDGKLLASSSEDDSIRLWKVASAQEVRRFQEHSKPIGSVAFSPDGRLLASSFGDNTIRLWKVASGQEVRRFQSYHKSSGSIAFSPDSKFLASCSEDNTVRLWNISSAQEVRRFQGHHKPVDRVTISPDGTLLASSSEDNTVRLWDISSGQETRQFLAPKSNGMAFSPNSRFLASCSSDRTIRLWELSSGRIRRFQGHHHRLTSVAFSPDGKYLASSSDDSTIRLWKVGTGACMAILAPLPEGWVAFSPDGRYKLGGIPAGGFWHVINLCRFEAGELDDWVPGLRLPDRASFVDLPPWTPEVKRPARLRR